MLAQSSYQGKRKEQADSTNHGPYFVQRFTQFLQAWWAIICVSARNLQYNDYWLIKITLYCKGHHRKVECKEAIIKIPSKKQVKYQIF